MVVRVGTRVRRSRWFVALLGVLLAFTLLPAVELPDRAPEPGTPAAVAGPGGVDRPLPREARSNKVPLKRSPVVPPGIAAAGAPRVLSAEEWARAPKPGAPRAAQVAQQDVVFEDVVLRPGFTLGDTSLVVYFNLHNDDKSFVTWTVRVFDQAAGTEQASSTLPVAEVEPACETIRKY
jgi:hypothetical protein